jgi:hypothetical protein
MPFHLNGNQDVQAEFIDMNESGILHIAVILTVDVLTFTALGDSRPSARNHVLVS